MKASNWLYNTASRRTSRQVHKEASLDTTWTGFRLVVGDKHIVCELTDEEIGEFIKNLQFIQERKKNTDV